MLRPVETIEERKNITIAAEIRPENLIIQSIFAQETPLRFFFFDLKSKRSRKREEMRNARDPLMSARAKRGEKLEREEKGIKLSFLSPPPPPPPLMGCHGNKAVRIPISLGLLLLGHSFLIEFILLVSFSNRGERSIHGIEYLGGEAVLFLV